MLLISTPRREILFRGGLLVVLAGACSVERDRESSVEGTASGSTVSIDTAPAPSADTTLGQADSAAAPARTASLGQPAAPKTKIRPSIDPGRKTTPPSPAAGDTSPAARDTPPATTPAPSGAAGSAGKDQWLSYDASSNTVTFQLIGGPTGFQFNGYSSGGATLVLPAKANVVMPFINKDGTPHSAEIISGEGPLPNAAVDAAISRAYTNQLLQGLPQEGTDTMRFQVPEKGTYRIFCGVPGHGLSGMWIWMRVDPAAKTPSFGPTKA